MPKISVGDRFAAPVTVTRVSEDGYYVTLDLRAYGYRITVPASSVEKWERLPPEKPGKREE